MKYIKYGITLSLLKESDIEMVRQWRNDPVVVRNYAFREYITPEMQKEWFKRINNFNNLYTIIHYNNEKVGVINLKNIDWENRTFEGGIFIPDEKQHNTPLPAIVSYLTTEIPLTWFDWNVGYAHVLRTNVQTHSFIRQLGYELAPGQEEAENQKYIITKASFERHAHKIRKAIKALTGDDEPGRLIIEPEDFNNEVALQFEAKAIQGSAYIRSETTPEGRIHYFT